MPSYDRVVPQKRAYSDEQIDEAIEALSDPERLETAQRRLLHVAPQLQRVLAEALESGGFFGQAHEEQVLKAAGAADLDERQRAVRTLIAEETRLGMLIGVAVGMELSHELAKIEPED